ncbi:hypothetical protein BKA67DRAFT_542124 [Truncatella angustata]|uniref:N-acetyltransferase domain-containing protein n=1 Tax=Truncatella angustata TaxID=152316 RepID=A0A9P8RFY4_9PEZI|nr:uncharacterized protein BKA67DRAFT_542124 [Truncatella angustata]KAH6645147.1 hypothetical protein BKA67DRAFT_542124 [Truncatella angustata]
MAEWETKTRLTLLPDEPLPAAYPKPTLSETEQIEVYRLDEFRAAIVVRKDKETQATSRIRGLWLSAQDDLLAREVLSFIRRQHTSAGKKTVLNVNGSQSAVLSQFEEQGFPFTAQVMTKRIDGVRTDARLPDEITYKSMDEDELQGFLAHVEHSLAQQEMANEDGGLAWEAAKERAHGIMTQLLPDRGSTAGHTFVSILEGGDSPVKVGCLWTYMNTEKQRSFCYDVEIEESMRGRGLGRKAVAR